MFCLASFLVLIYCIDKALLLRFATTSVYDTQRLSIAFARWWCAPTTVLLLLVIHWARRAKYIQSTYLCALLPLAHIVVYGMVMLAVERRFGHQKRRLRQYPNVLKEMQAKREGGDSWDFFNTNPIFCIRAHRLGAEESGWSDICAKVRRPESSLRPFVRGQVPLPQKA